MVEGWDTFINIFSVCIHWKLQLALEFVCKEQVNE
jgi:hypothetical protein